MPEHPTPFDLEAFLEGRLSKEKTRHVVRHLIRGCLSCAAQLRRGRDRLLLRYTRLPAEEDAAYSQRLKHSDRLARHLRREKERADEIAPLLVEGGIRRVVQDADLPLSGLGMYLALLERSWAVRHENPREMVSLARAAVEVAGKLDPNLYSAQVICDLQAQAWGELANSLRVADDLDEAERAFGTAFNFFQNGTGDLHVKVRLYDLNASFLGTRRRFDLAFAALDLVHTTYLELGDRHLGGRALIIKAIYTHYRGDSEEAIRINDEGLAMLDKKRDADLLFQAIHNRIWFLMACNRFSEAKRALFLHRSELKDCGGRVSRLKLRWLQGKISLGLKEWESAKIAFLETREGFEDAGLGFAAALISLDFALVLLHQGNYREGEDVVIEAAEVFFALGIHREALSAVMILKDAFEKRQGSLVLLESVIEFLRRLQIDPDARFTPRFE